MFIEDRIHAYVKHYTAAPQWVKTMAGGIYSVLPPALRYGRAYGRFMADIRQSSDPSLFQPQAQARLLQTLRHAANTVPAHAHMKAEAARDRSGLELLAQFPLLEKADFKANTARYLSSAMPASTHLMAYTGGSTSVPMKLYLEKSVSRSKDFAYNSTFDHLSGVGRGDIILALRGRTVPGSERPDGPIWMFDPIKRYLHLSSDHLEPKHMQRYLGALRKWKPTFVHAFPSALVPLFRWLHENDGHDVLQRLRGVQLFSENVYDHQLEFLGSVLNCPVLLDYGHSERAVKAISLKEDSRYFFWPLYGKVELVDRHGKPITQPGVLGEIVATGFDNRVMPLVRYRTGDLAMWSARPNTTRPGFDVVDKLEGRVQEFLVCSDHRLISIATIGAAHFEQLSGSDLMQFEQSEPGRAKLLVVSPVALASGVADQLRAGILEKTQGGLDVEVLRVERIARTVTGKHPLLVQRIDLSGYLGARI
jgi:phenylacetate-CoA ligase